MIVPMRLQMLRVIPFSLLAFGTSATWTVYNRYVPDLLAQLGASAALIGFILILDSLSSLVLEPTTGALSDSVLIPGMSKRLPFIAIGAPLAALAFALLPLIFLALPSNGIVDAGKRAGLLSPFIIATIIMLAAMAIFRTPIFTMIGDIFPAPTRGQAAGIVNALGAIGTLAAAQTSRLRFSGYATLPRTWRTFWRLNKRRETSIPPRTSFSC
jgi:maltose/moltooligosaccharide transporter